MIWDEEFFASYIEYTIKNFKETYDVAQIIKNDKARCPICNSELKEELEVGKLNLYECDNCLEQFVVERLGSIYFLVAYNNEKDEK